MILYKSKVHFEISELSLNNRVESQPTLTSRIKHPPAADLNLWIPMRKAPPSALSKGPCSAVSVSLGFDINSLDL